MWGAADKHVDRYHSFLTYFDLPSGWVIAQLIDYFDAGGQPPTAASAKAAAAATTPASASASADSSTQAAPPATIKHPCKYEQVFLDVVAGYHYNFAEFTKGWYFAAFRDHISHYIYRRPDVRRWLEELRAVHGRKLFLITNSYYDYANLLLTHMFGADWCHSPSHRVLMFVCLCCS